jgi:predicted PurR-regulated permease PerM
MLKSSNVEMAQILIQASERTMSQSSLVSYVIFIVLVVLISSLHLGTFLLAVLFGYLALQMFCIGGRKWLSITLYLVAMIAVVVGLVYFSSLAYRTFPKMVDSAIPAIAEFAEKNGIQLPFTDYASLKSAALNEAQEGFAVVGRYAGLASYQFVQVVVGLVIALSMFLGSGWTTDRNANDEPANLYLSVTSEITARFKSLYDSFARVIGAQIVISAINTTLTAVFLLLNNYPYPGLLITFVFLCGLIPILGNIISNSLIVGVGFTFSAHAGLYALLFLVVIHKLEYFLNSKIVGSRIKCPMWLTLIGLILGEKLMGLSGMVLAPVALHFIRVEASAIRTKPVFQSHRQ